MRQAIVRAAWVLIVLIGLASTTGPAAAQAMTVDVHAHRGGAGLAPENTLAAFRNALGMDIDSSANINWRGASLNRPDYQRLIPTGIIAFRRAG